MGEPLEIRLCCQDERPVPSVELEIVAHYNLIRLLRPRILEEATVAVADLTIERRLIIHTSRQTINHLIFLIIRFIGNACPWTDIHLMIIAPIIGPHTSSDDKLALILVRNRPRVLDKAIHIIDGQPIVRLVREVRLDVRQHIRVTANHIGEMW